MVIYKRGELPPITKEREAELQELAKAPAEDIDFSDIPPLDETFWKNAVKIPSTEKVAAIRRIVNVLTWLKSMGRGYQKRINRNNRNLTDLLALDGDIDLDFPKRSQELPRDVDFFLICEHDFTRTTIFLEPVTVFV